MVSRRKPAVTRRILVDLGNASTEDPVLTAVSASVGLPMSPDTNHNEQVPDNNPKQKHKLMNGCHKEAVIPEQVINGSNGLSLQGLLTMQVVKSGGVAEDIPKDLVSAKAAVGEQQDEEEKIQEYLKRSDTAVIFAEPVGQHSNVPSLTNGVTKDAGDISGTENFLKCPQCQKGYSSIPNLKEHLESCPTLLDEGNSAVLPPTSTSSSPPPGVIAGNGSFTCSQCATSFTTKDQLEKHELLHSPNAQVSCKVCHKTFANVYRLQRHMISHDESAILRKFKCTECEKAFKFKHHLKEHIRIHSGEKPFECSNCGKRFSHSGSYSSHMTSKKCLVMNLKMGRNRTTANSLLDKNQIQQNRGPKRSPITTALNNNISTSPNHNTPYLPILPKYMNSETAAFLSVMASHDGSYPPTSLANATGLHPFYMTPPSLHLGAAAHPISPYTMSASLGQLLEQLQTSQSSPRIPLPVTETNIDKIKKENDCDLSENKNSITNIKMEEQQENHENSRCSDELVMDTEDAEMENDDDKIDSAARNSPGVNSNSGDLEAVKRILETVNATVTKQLLQVNMQKISSDSPRSDCQSVSSSVSITDCSNQFACSVCKKNFNSQSQLDSHDCDAIQSEGLAAKLEQAVHVKKEEVNGNVSGAEEEMESDYRENEKVNDDYEIDGESVTTTDHVAEDGRKVRVRSLIADEQLAILKDHYARNPRPKREELSRIAERIGFPVRVVQVWFQNTRARDRREGRLVHIPYSPATSCFPQSLVPSTTSQMALTRTLPYGQTSPHHSYNSSSEQPLDLSTKKPLSSISSPSSSPQRPTSAIAHSDSGEEAVNLSQKSSRSPTPFQQLPYQSGHYQHSNCSSDYHRSPSPVLSDTFANGSKLARILAQPTPRFNISNVSSAMGLVPMERLLQFNSELNASRSPLLNTSCSSPNSERRSWKADETEDSGVSQETYPTEDELCPAKRSKLAQIALKTLNNTLLTTTSTSSPDTEIEGQFICDQCDKAFSKQSSLARHKYEHSGQRPHKCDECPKAFKHKHHLTEHKRLHSGEKPFQCSKCLKRFSHSGSYSQHMNHRYSYCKPYRE